MGSIHDFTVKNIDGEDTSLAGFKGKALLVVNVASACGLTPHYKGLQSLYEELEGKGFAVLGFPCNQFGAQEPGSEAEIKEFCSTKFNVTFPMFSKLEVNGGSKHELYAWLTEQDTKPDGSGDITWNFEKFVVGKDGQVVARFNPRTAPDDAALREAIDKALG